MLKFLSKIELKYFIIISPIIILLKVIDFLFENLYNLRFESYIYNSVIILLIFISLLGRYSSFKIVFDTAFCVGMLLFSWSFKIVNPQYLLGCFFAFAAFANILEALTRFNKKNLFFDAFLFLSISMIFNPVNSYYFIALLIFNVISRGYNIRNLIIPFISFICIWALNIAYLSFFESTKAFFDFPFYKIWHINFYALNTISIIDIFILANSVIILSIYIFSSEKAYSLKRTNKWILISLFFVSFLTETFLSNYTYFFYLLFPVSLMLYSIAQTANKFTRNLLLSTCLLFSIAITLIKIILL